MSWKLEMTRDKQEVQLECCRKTGKSSTSSHGIQVAGHEQVQHVFHPNIIQHCPIVVHGIGSHDFDFCILGPSLKMFNLYTEHHARLTFLLLDKEIAKISPMCTGHLLHILTVQGKNSGQACTSSNIMEQKAGFSMLKVKTPGECSIKIWRMAASDPSLIASRNEPTKKRSGSRV